MTVSGLLSGGALGYSTPSLFDSDYWNAADEYRFARNHLRTARHCLRTGTVVEAIHQINCAIACRDRARKLRDRERLVRVHRGY